MPASGQKLDLERTPGAMLVLVSTYSPAQVVEQTGFSHDTLRYYERIGLLHGIARTTGGQRVFSDDDIGWLNILKCLRDTGMPIAAMLRFAELCRQGDDTIRSRVTLLEEHDRAVEEQIAHLRDQQHQIRNKIQWYKTASPASHEFAGA